ncbi:hypothetical protein PORY_000892 [Pneumocystis oryctolagi]|uniref:Uncharacterized protein n=1 Tax=Pneumocystis oryctolagi TaxID=42067 RepID=A0ACB7CH00_9ASCO|nr:hypothetical protein PORY_000892 [Pneumocystis oryctolagi]
MVKLREIPRTATFAWSHCDEGTWLATGTIPGVIDSGFSNKIDLELWKLDLMDWSPELFELAQPNSVISSDMRFNDIAWSCMFEGRQKGIIAGAMENGALNLWDADLIFSGASKNECLIAQNTTHSGVIKSLDFNTTQTKLLASAGENGEIWIWDMESPTKPYSSGQKSNQLGEIQSVAFNKDEKVPYILATAGNSGITSVWDLRARKAVVNLQFPGIGGGKKGMSSVIWHPNFATKIITASEEDTAPVILMWDLRNSHAPEKVLSGHEAGVLSVSWCKHDSELLLSCGKDNRTLCWNPFSGELIGEFPRSNNWAFRVSWSSKNPDVIANASYDGKIIIQTIQTVQTLKAENTVDTVSSTSNADFFDNIPSYIRPYESSLLLKKPPKWHIKKCSASFGFGGKLVTFGTNKASGSNIVKILNITEESNIIENANNFEEVLKNNEIKTYCQKKVQETDDLLQKQVWEILFILLHEDFRDRFPTFLGFKKDDIENDMLEKIKNISFNKETKELEHNQETLESTEENLEGLFKKHEINNDFLNLKLSSSEKNIFSHLSPLVGPFSIFNDSDSELDKIITRSIFLGQFDKAVDLCLQEDRLSDALMFSFCGGKECQKRAQKAYFKKYSDVPYIRLLSSIIEGDLKDIALNMDLKDWKEALVIICTFSKPENFSELCNILGDRINTEFRSKNSDSQMRNQAVLCYLMGIKLGKLIDIWVEEFQEKEVSIFKCTEACDNSNISPYSIYTKLLQEFIEKITILKKIINSNDVEKSINSDTLSLLYKKYNDYANIMASQGSFVLAQKYLNLLPDNYNDSIMAKERIAKSLNPHCPNIAPKNSSNSQQLPYTPLLSQESMLNPYAANLYTPQSYRPYTQHPGIVNQQTSSYSVNNSQPPPQNFPYSTTSTQSTYVTTQQKNSSIWNDAPILQLPKKPIRPANHISSPFGQNTTQYDQNSIINKKIDQYPLKIQKQVYIPPPPMVGQKYQGYSQTMQTNVPGSYNLPCNVQSNNSYMKNNSGVPEMNVAGLNIYGANITNPYVPIHNIQQSVNSGYSKLSPKPMVSPSSNVEQCESLTKSNQLSGSYVSQAKTLYSRQEPSVNSPQEQNMFPVHQPLHQVPLKTEHLKPSQNNASSNFIPKPAISQDSKYPSGDRSHIPPSLKPIFEGLSSEMERVKQYAPSGFTRQIQDTERRLNILFDHLNNNTGLSKDLLDEMKILVNAMLAKDYQVALNIHVNLVVTKTEECGHWMIGVKRLLELSIDGKICFGGVDDQPTLGKLISPCRCQGTIKWVHIKCLSQWRIKSKFSKSYYRCEQCHYEYLFLRPQLSAILVSYPSLLICTALVFLGASFIAGFVVKLIFYFGFEYIVDFLFYEPIPIPESFVYPRSLWQIFSVVDTTHFLVGFLSLGAVGIIQLLGPIRNYRILLGDQRRRHVLRFRDGFMIFYLLGMLKIIWNLYKKVQNWSRYWLELLGNRILEVDEQSNHT